MAWYSTSSKWISQYTKRVGNHVPLWTGLVGYWILQQMTSERNQGLHQVPLSLAGC